MQWHIDIEGVADAKIEEMRKDAVARMEIDIKRQSIENALKQGKLTLVEITEIFEVELECVGQLQVGMGKW
jgi:hypothetical protein